MTPSRALITGASSGIGEAFARVLAARGCGLVLVARRGERLEALARELGGEAHVLPADLVAPGAVEALAGELARRGLEVDLLVNNAGLGHTGAFVEAPPERLDEIVDLNVRAVTGLTRRLVPGMLERGRGAVVNVVSMSAFQPVPFLAAYAASKAFVLSLTEALAVEIAGRGVVVQAVCPGNVPTGFQSVAGTDRVRFDATPPTSPAAVAEASLRALDGGRVRVFPSWRDRLGAELVRFAPRRVVHRVAADLFRPR